MALHHDSESIRRFKEIQEEAEHLMWSRRMLREGALSYQNSIFGCIGNTLVALPWNDSMPNANRDAFQASLQEWVNKRIRGGARRFIAAPLPGMGMYFCEAVLNIPAHAAADVRLTVMLPKILRADMHPDHFVRLGWILQRCDNVICTTRGHQGIDILPANINLKLVETCTDIVSCFGKKPYRVVEKALAEATRQGKSIEKLPVMAL